MGVEVCRVIGLLANVIQKAMKFWLFIILCNFRDNVSFCCIVVRKDLYENSKNICFDLTDQDQINNVTRSKGGSCLSVIVDVRFLYDLLVH